MPTKINCPNCDVSLNLPDAAAGKKVRCTKCNTPFIAPAGPLPSATMKPPVTAKPSPPSTPTQSAPATLASKATSVREHASETAVDQMASTPTPIVAAPVAAPGNVRCPKCGSTQVTANQRGFSHGKACLSWCLGLGILSIFCGGMGKNKILITCLSCGHQWKAGKA